jgi:hypothetical protein
LHKNAFCTVFWDMEKNLPRNLHAINNLHTGEKRAIYMTRPIFRRRPLSANFFANQWRSTG